MSGVNGKAGKFVAKHGLSRHPGYRTWRGMIQRCENSDHPFFGYYGARGIAVCKEWRDGPEAFLAWLDASGWAPGMQIDRMNNDSGYSPENCRAVTKIENGCNRRNNRIVEVDGKAMPLSEAARHLGVPIGTLSARLCKGFTGSRLIAPSRPKRPSKGAA